ncbi:MAG: ABC transporter ATP-binding protein [Gemmatimonadetes bacterium]|jgi:Cu-processing system ATP-binding protein|nr:ABC transporter ATP-binding protein [Gemmatimonadota bacterium]MBT4611715.1 ABC transporter ATP-binding protein [Gemmatimonadota bacterium]MBT5059417.1 ABC transporter ATP-binding protein [Gemmatimonadota bacterium]MBT5146505.1 ABC transporter ATP-binding protein [Gemmatimonadota bacterium]MBT5591426.1 ABC transporter ATP-binding protein [Gemmatimonadota bacterium]
MTLCRLQDIRMGYGGEQVLRGVDLAIEGGTILGLVGENGAGKSTLLKILAGVLRPVHGSLVAAGSRPRVGYMPESSQWYPYLSGAQVLRYFARYTGASKQAQDETLERVGLAAVRDKKLAAYSKGMRQKLGLAQAILGQPDLIVLDEPTNGLDPPGIIDFYQILQERAEQGVAIVLSSHLLAEIEGRTTHVAFLRDGQIAASGSCAHLIQQAGLQSRVCLRGARRQDLLCGLLDGSGWQVQTQQDGVDVYLDRNEVSVLLASLDLSLLGHLDVQVHHPTLDDLYMHTLAANRSAVTPGTNGRAKSVRVEAG